ncbi:36.4 kDa proline-rich protein-like [Hibiscus syriacus]|uniref:36.4 kDa proline-rich protein-like n=1 Tax=Hibiscus syriacus TaxID=106335 RepID=UPI001921B7CD|nr:36.4 kDa proline-rich protein-like [Hibiscus syriacus]
MEFTKISALFLIGMLFISSAAPILGCGSCGKPPPKHRNPKGKSPKGPIPIPPIVRPPINLPPVVPPVTVPPIVKPPVDLPPVSVVPPSGKPCPSAPTCPIDTLKLGACVDLLGGLVHIGLGDPVVNTCCPVLAGLVELEAAACLCTTLKLKVLNLNIYVPLALQLLVTCGKTPPPGYTCPL